VSTFRKRSVDAQLEAEGLAWLAEARALRVVKVIAIDGQELTLERISGTRGPRFDEALGRGLADLHRFGAPSFGYARDNFIAELPQDNTVAASWPEFYRERRLMPLARRVGREKIIAQLRIDTPDEPPARLHGDLWNGNVLADEDGLPVLIDPSVYGGHREMDLAMMRLFGGFSARTFAAYHAHYPLAPGHEARVKLHQLYPLLVHAVLFGGGYLAQFDDAAAAFKA
jgi:fructosamine-3-kinase